MNLSRHARRHYEVKPTTEPPITAWEASFDRGVTWHQGTKLTGSDAGWYRWLVAGPSVDKGDAVAVLAVGTCAPLARGVSNPEIVVEDLPAIHVS